MEAVLGLIAKIRYQTNVLNHTILVHIDGVPGSANALGANATNIANRYQTNVLLYRASALRSANAHRATSAHRVL
jgi:hypothetical protein